MLKRTISAIIAFPILFYIVYKSGIYLEIAALLISVIGLYEFYKAFHSRDYRPLNWVSYVFTLAMYAVVIFNMDSMFYFFVVVFFIFSLLVFHLFSKREQALMDIMITMLGFFYVTVSFVHIPLLAKIDNNFYIWYVFLLAWVTDTCAYFSGKLLGTKKLIPSVSPNKTIEGSLGGIIGTTLFAYCFAYFFNKDFLMASIFLGLLGGILSQIGDLIASKFKRIVDLKDFGNLMPGHGGVLDRFDSIIVTGPLVFYFVYIFEMFFR